MSEILRTTHSVCPACGARLAAQYVQRGNEVYLERRCPEHGNFSVLAWRGDIDFLTWCGAWEDKTAENTACPGECGLCGGHQNRTCCAILDVTERCNLRCPFCFAASGEGQDMPQEEVFAALEDMYAKGIRFLHLAGGEPTVRDDLDQIAAYAARLGYQYIQLNTNGLRLAEEEGYAQKLCDAGVSSVFLQFDGVTDDIYRQTRGRALMDIKRQAIENCDKAELGIVLVATVVPGINDGALGSILRFALDNMPAVKGVHLQPVTYTGRYTAGKKPRITIPEVLSGMEVQTGGLIRAEWFSPSACDSPLCGFHAEFRRNGDLLVPLFESSGSCCADSTGVEGNQNHVKNRWTRVKRSSCKPGSLDAFLLSLNEKSFCISGMAFQDRENLDLGRLMRCSVHVYADGRLIPFCAWHNIHKPLWN